MVECSILLSFFLFHFLRSFNLYIVTLHLIVLRVIEEFMIHETRPSALLSGLVAVN